MDVQTSEVPPNARGRLPGAMEVQSILHSREGSSSHVSPTLPESFPLSASPPTLSRSSSTASRQSHARSYTIADPTRNRKRLTMTIPIQTAGTAGYSRTTPSPTKSTTPATIPENIASPTGSTDSNFLTALATQERRVLELREELGRAEIALRQLKSEWAAHEAQKKRHDARKVQKLRPLSATMPSVGLREDDSSGASAWVTQEMERRKAIMGGVRTSNRKVFSGSRHARALSLLTTDTRNGVPVAQAETEPASAHSHTSDRRPSLPKRASTNADLTTVVADADDNIDLTLPREVLMKTGRQMASDLKDGLWTFIEDLRQVTVGEEGVNGTQQRNQSRAEIANGQKLPRKKLSLSTPRSNGKSRPTIRHTASDSTNATRLPGAAAPRLQREESDNLIDIGGSFWKTNGVNEPKKADVKKSSKKSTTPIKAFHRPSGSIESWDNWDSPATEVTAEKSTRAIRSDSKASIVEDGHIRDTIGRNTPRTSVSSSREEIQPQRASTDRARPDAIPWPALTKLSPGNLRRTASHLMTEWERSLTPPPGDGEGQVDQIERSASGSKDAKAD